VKICVICGQKMKLDNIITGDHVRLRPLTEADMALKVAWYNDPAVRKTLVVDENVRIRKKQFDGSIRWRTMTTGPIFWLNRWRVCRWVSRA